MKAINNNIIIVLAIITTLLFGSINISSNSVLAQEGVGTFEELQDLTRNNNETHPIGSNIVYKPDIDPNSNITRYDNPFNLPPVCKIVYATGMHDSFLSLAQTAGPTSYDDEFVNINDTLSCKHTLTDYVKNGWTIGNTFSSEDTLTKAQYTYIELHGPE